MIPLVDITRSELIEHIRARRVTLDFVRGDRATVTIDHGRSCTIKTVPVSWVESMRRKEPSKP